MATFKYQETFADDLTQAWLDGKGEHVRTVIRNLKNKAQAAYIAAQVAANLRESFTEDGEEHAGLFADFMHPNNR